MDLPQSLGDRVKSSSYHSKGALGGWISLPANHVRKALFLPDRQLYQNIYIFLFRILPGSLPKATLDDSSILLYEGDARYSMIAHSDRRLRVIVLEMSQFRQTSLRYMTLS